MLNKRRISAYPGDNDIVMARMLPRIGITRSSRTLPLAPSSSATILLLPHGFRSTERVARDQVWACGSVQAATLLGEIHLESLGCVLFVCLGSCLLEMPRAAKRRSDILRVQGT